jgi:hypothetical protein
MSVLLSSKPSFSYCDILKKGLICPKYNAVISHKISSDISISDSQYEYIETQNFLNSKWKLPGGKKYQRDGLRLENAFYNGLSKRIKNFISVNVKPKHPNGNIIIEFDMIYKSESSKRIISFEIKGVNPFTINNFDRQKKLIAQGVRQKNYLKDNYPDYKVDVIFCFVVGKNKKNIIITNDNNASNTEWKAVYNSRSKYVLDPEFIKNIKYNDINVAIGETPQECAVKSLKILNLLN